MRRQFHTREGGCGGMVSLLLIGIIAFSIWTYFA